ncbi:winged helix-turn-helix transcriptional regulator [Xanthomonas campestris pv. badrii]|uniref:Winged helix-turn-helix transcriptional regulator n=1 Tax=Xanthomonas campestris pv. badrii TaxID=149696 RepID=A0A7Z2ZIQ6_XANCA|nr:MarR family winged helix-turn-helix transcriptional regulator [Xanthomonas campestris]MCC4605671.1 MarR family winged helix-turn-helix transcriptional regulator [Xanthomonas campestris pv. parthenii]QJD69538.1 winged helix-turn-helix transcriptional regulator [Xanthomonas campestris pv. badrii]
MATPSKPTGCTNFCLRSVSRVVSRHYDAVLGSSGLKTTQYSLLSHLVGLSPIRPSDLSRRMGLDASTLTRNLRPLMLAGLVAQGDGADARSRLITLTAAGRRRHAQAETLWQQAQSSLETVLGSAQVLALHALLDDTLLKLQHAGLDDGLDDTAGSSP